MVASLVAGRRLLRSVCGFGLEQDRQTRRASAAAIAQNGVRDNEPTRDKRGLLFGENGQLVMCLFHVYVPFSDDAVDAARAALRRASAMRDEPVHTGNPLKRDSEF
jgi:hypothetical protein